MELVCIACNKDLDLALDDELCPECFEAYLDNLKDILPKDPE